MARKKASTFTPYIGTFPSAEFGYLLPFLKGTVPDDLHHAIHGLANLINYGLGQALPDDGTPLALRKAATPGPKGLKADAAVAMLERTMRRSDDPAFKKAWAALPWAQIAQAFLPILLQWITSAAA